MLRLAQKYGPGIYQQRLSDHLPLPAPASWRGVRFRDAVDMATGIGSGSHTDSPNRISDGYLTDRAEYDRWYQSPTAEEKLRVTFEEPAYPWGPGKVARYRDEDPLLLAAAMDGYLRTRAGPDADLWSTLADEVYRPLGIVHLPQARTAPGADGRTLPIAAFGMYATVADLVRVARLLRDGGRLDGIPLLWPEGVAQELDYRHTRGFATGQFTRAGEVRYAHYFWNVPFEHGGCRANVPQMQGWGGDVVALLPNGMIAFRIAHDAEEAPDSEEMERLLRAAHAARSFCAKAG
jgi:hypothetical protein